MARNIRPFDAAVVSVTQIHAGDAYNVIPARAMMCGTARGFTPETMRLIGERIAKIAAERRRRFRRHRHDRLSRHYPPLINHPAETKFIADVAAATGRRGEHLRDGRQLMASEDFSFMLNARPGAFIYIGNGDGEGSCEVHNPNYDFNDAILPLGASLWVAPGRGVAAGLDQRDARQ